ncbi:MAG: hypothetical protein CL762_00695 [Chloroflexi bacterium]|nr:hypothetical protein [Chloroflexota bacterium]|tara:strand:- start:1536 stop:2198 length:663 start_codon:yes stop_codon:yes gene_type:complete
MKIRPIEVIEKYGRCIELISMDPFFNDITVGLFFKEPNITVFSYSNLDGVSDRLKQIRDRIVNVSGAMPHKDNPHQATFICGMKEGCCSDPLRFVLKEAVTKDRDLDLSKGIICKDLRSEMMIKVNYEDNSNGKIYTVSGDDNTEKPIIRYRAIANGLIKYGAFERVDNFSFKLNCNQRNDKIVNLLLPLARNISATEESLAAEDAAGQMTTQSLGFSAN